MTWQLVHGFRVVDGAFAALIAPLRTLSGHCGVVRISGVEAAEVAPGAAYSARVYDNWDGRHATLKLA
jgi:hypothetical protein